jgi:hypothetical protein
MRNKYRQVRYICNMSGWPSGLRRQTQGYLVYFVDWMSVLVLSEGVGSNPTPDNFFFHWNIFKFPVDNKYYVKIFTQNLYKFQT